MLNCRDVKRKVSHVSTIGNSHMTNDILKAALAEYNLEQTNASLLRSLGNSTYKVVADDEKCFSLRIYSPDNFDEAQVSSELTWLRFLSSENTIVVPNPDGSL